MTQKPGSSGIVLYGTASFVTSLLVMQLLLAHGCQWLLALMVPVAVATLLFTKRAYFLVLVPGAVFFAIVLGETQNVATLDTYALLLILACLFLFSFVTRLGHFLVALEPGVPSPMASGSEVLARGSTTLAKPTSCQSTWAEWCGLILAVLSVGIALWWTAPLQRGLPPAHHIGLVGEAYLGIQILLASAAALIGMGGFVHYVRRHRTMLARPRPGHQDLLDDAGSAAFSLQEEAWQWQRGDRLRVARAQARARTRHQARNSIFSNSRRRKSP